MLETFEDIFEEEIFEEDFPLKNKKRGKRRKTDFHKKQKKLNIVNIPKYPFHNLSNYNHENYYTYGTLKKRPYKKIAHKKERHSVVVNGCYYKKIYDLKWICT